MSVQLLLIDDDTSVSSGITQAPRLHERPPLPPISQHSCLEVARFNLTRTLTVKC